MCVPLLEFLLSNVSQPLFGMRHELPLISDVSDLKGVPEYGICSPTSTGPQTINIDGKGIASGTYLFFTATVQFNGPSNPPPDGAVLEFNQQSIQLGAPFSTTLVVPNSKVCTNYTSV
jgi:hypothetical protein